MWSKKELIEKQARFWVLMAQGSTLQAACDAVGVNRRTGRHWRQATGGQIPRKTPEPSGRHLCLEERLRIADLHLAGTGVGAIATQVGRSASTISRELRRNGPQTGPRGRGKYAPYAAQKRDRRGVVCPRWLVETEIDAVIAGIGEQHDWCRRLLAGYRCKPLGYGATLLRVR